VGTDLDNAGMCYTEYAYRVQPSQLQHLVQVAWVRDAIDVLYIERYAIGHTFAVYDTSYTTHKYGILCDYIIRLAMCAVFM
jgi:hypothetical protein